MKGQPPGPDMTANPLTLPEQYVYTSGACQIFIAAAQRVVGGVPTVIVATDERQLEAHGYPTDEPLDLHIALKMDDGTFVDAEGRRSLDALLDAFGVEEDYSYDIKDDAALDALGKPKRPELVDALEKRLRELGWEEGAPPASGDLQDRKLFRQASEQAHTWWPQWEHNFALPVEMVVAKKARKP